MRLSAEDRIDVLEYRSDALEEALARFMEFTEEVIRDNKESDRKLRDEMKDFRERSEKADEKFRKEMQAYRERSEKADEKFRKEMKDFRKRSEAADKKFREEMKTLREESEKADRELRERSEKADRELRQEINRTRGELSNRLGTLAEDMVVPGIPGIARQYFDVPGVDFLTVHARKRSSSDPSRIKEFDGIAVSEKYFFVNETKSNPKPEYAKEFVESLPEIADFFPEYADRKLIPVFSSLYIPPDVVVYLSRKGVYAMGMKDDGMDLLNFDEVAASGIKHYENHPAHNSFPDDKGSAGIRASAFCGRGSGQGQSYRAEGCHYSFGKGICMTWKSGQGAVNWERRIMMRNYEFKNIITDGFPRFYNNRLLSKIKFLFGKEEKAVMVEREDFAARMKEKFRGNRELLKAVEKCVNRGVKKYEYISLTD